MSERHREVRRLADRLQRDAASRGTPLHPRHALAQAEAQVALDMTTHEAEERARHEWGEYGYVKRHRDVEAHRQFEVGDRRPGGIWGAGRSWVEAFEDARRRRG